MRLVEQHLESRQGIALRARDDAARAARGEQLAVGEVGVVAAQVDVDTRGARDRPRDAVLLHHRRRDDADALRPGVEDRVADDEALDLRHATAHRRDGLGGTVEPTCGDVVAQPADAVEHVVQAAAGDLLHDGLQFLALAEHVEHRCDSAELQRVRAEEHEVVEHPVQFGEQRARPRRALGHLHAECPLDREAHADLAAERRKPVVTVRQHEDLPVVAHLEQLLRTAVHVPDDRFALRDALAVEGDAQAQDAVRGRVLRADVEHHVRRRETPGSHADRQFTRARRHAVKSAKAGRQSSGAPRAGRRAVAEAGGASAAQGNQVR